MDSFRRLFEEAPARRLTGHWHLRNLAIALLPATLLVLALEPKRRQLERARLVRSRGAHVSHALPDA